MIFPCAAKRGPRRTSVGLSAGTLVGMRRNCLVCFARYISYVMLAFDPVYTLYDMKCDHGQIDYRVQVAFRRSQIK